MEDKILRAVKNFFQDRDLSGGPVLLGLSGGPDSLALFHLLLEVKKNKPFSLHVAHVDHGWRQESTEESSYLEKYVADFGVAFHLKKLTNCYTEEKAREERLLFFSQLYQKLGCQVLLLGHQKDDQSETVLKRILEGAHVTAFGGMTCLSHLRGMTIGRPLLKHTKKDIMSWLKKKGLGWFEDPTNSSPKFLRARMRTEIFPELSKKFGKQVADNLCKVGCVAQELKEYLERKIKPYWALVQKNQGETRIDFNALPFFESIEIKYFLKKILEEENIELSYDSHMILYHLLEAGASKKKILSKKKIIEIHRRVVAIKNIEGY